MQKLFGVISAIVLLVAAVPHSVAQTVYWEGFLSNYWAEGLQVHLEFEGTHPLGRNVALSADRANNCNGNTTFEDFSAALNEDWDGQVYTATLNSCAVRPGYMLVCIEVNGMHMNATCASFRIDEWNTTFFERLR